MGGEEPEAGLGRPLLPQEAGLSHIGGKRDQASSICGKFHSLGMCFLVSKACLGQGQGSLGK